MNIPLLYIMDLIVGMFNFIYHMNIVIKNGCLYNNGINQYAPVNELVTLGYFYVCTKPNTVYTPL